MGFLLPILTLITEFVWQKAINYPPTLEQLRLGVGSFPMLWGVRIFSLVLLIASIYLVSTFVSKAAKKYFWIFLGLCPLLSLVWMSHPMDILKIFLVSLIFYVFHKRTQNLIATTTICCLAIIALSLFVFRETPGILEDLSFKKVQEEITFRFNVEDNLKPNIKLPLIIRRIGYNKYFFVVKNTSQEILRFFDIETLFFQEVHPLGQKGFVIFFWPQAFILGISVYLILGIRRKDIVPKILSFFVMALTYYLFSSDSTDRRHLFSAISLAFLMSEGVALGFSGKKKVLRSLLIAITILTFYGWTTNIYDRFVRPDFWLDNRPIAYDFVLNAIKDKDLTNYSRILVPDTLYATKDYCKLYLADCSKFKSENFDLYRTLPQKDILYVGFTGNLMGDNFIDSSAEVIESTLVGKGLNVYAVKHLINNIASGYGQELVVAGAPKQ